MGNRLTGEEPRAESKSYGDIFDEAFPHYLVMGMTAEQYWDGESSLKPAFRKAYRIRIENEERMMDRQAWLQGVYIRDALQSVALLVNGFMPKGVRPERYPQRPRLETAETEKRKETQKKQKENQTMLAMAMFQAMAENFNRGFDKRQKKEQEQQAVQT